MCLFYRMNAGMRRLVHAQTKRYLLWFAIVNVALLAILLGCSLVAAPYVL